MVPKRTLGYYNDAGLRRKEGHVLQEETTGGIARLHWCGVFFKGHVGIIGPIKAVIVRRKRYEEALRK